ncbi:polysaccharide biosynthesis/export family protein [Silvibacterium acidisoli]|uniref:polysaccharide biosynthesis/export family protein n=1 Tax=Acidobacteriaceae bacterium ZG23-2 TaxID=2883246 RepID=UPI00406C78BD
MRPGNSTRLLTLFASAWLSVGSCFAQNIALAGNGGAPAPVEARPGGSADLQSGKPAKAPGEVSQYLIGPADVIHISVWKNNDLSQTVTVGPDGFVSLPLLGDVHVAGMTANQLSEMLGERLASYVVKAQVTVSVVEIRSRQVYVMGQVGKPGGYPLIAPITVLQVIAQAGGLSVFAHRKGILVLRESAGTTQRLKFDYVAALNGDVKQNIVLQPGDTVVVP